MAGRATKYGEFIRIAREATIVCSGALYRGKLETCSSEMAEVKKLGSFHF